MPGKAIVRESDQKKRKHHWVDVDDNDGGSTVADCGHGANAFVQAVLYADAHNTAIACDMLPSELLSKLRAVEVDLLRMAQEDHCAPIANGWDAATEWQTRRDIARRADQAQGVRQRPNEA